MQLDDMRRVADPATYTFFFLEFRVFRHVRKKELDQF